jgi:hypothetical protein
MFVFSPRALTPNTISKKKKNIDSRIYVDSRLQHMVNLRFDVPFFERGNFPTSVSNASQQIVVPNPWSGRGNSAPFDQRTCERPILKKKGKII